MERLFEDPSRPLARARRPRRARAAPAEPTAAYLEERFRRTGRDIGNALDPLLAFTRGHPQRTMLVAHHLWDLVPRGSVADEAAFVEARDRALEQAETALRARWESLAVNEQRVQPRARDTAPRGLYAEDTLRFLGLKKGSVDRALAGSHRKSRGVPDGRRAPSSPIPCSSTGSPSAASSESSDKLPYGHAAARSVLRRRRPA